MSSNIEGAQRAYEDLVGKGLKLDLTRGRPSQKQLDLSNDLLALPGTEYTAASGADCRNYGGTQGLPELRQIFAPLANVPIAQLVAAGNSSLELMHDALVNAMLNGVPGSERRWVDEPEVAFLCPVPGYDRHFTLCERFGIRMISVPMHSSGPDMDIVEDLVANDASIKGIWCVPRYSNPDGAVYSDETVQRLAEMPTAAPDFRIVWDDAYVVHTLTDSVAELGDVLALSATAGHPDRPWVFMSTSKVTYAGAGVAFFAGSTTNIEWWLKILATRTIGPDKVNHLRHARFLKDQDGLMALMAQHREILRPKFDLVERLFAEGLSDLDSVSWSTPTGGYFVTLTVPADRASKVVALAADAGIALTPAGATHPHGREPEDRTIRIAPSYPELDDLELAISGVVDCVRLAALAQ